MDVSLKDLVPDKTSKSINYQTPYSFLFSVSSENNNCVSQVKRYNR